MIFETQACTSLVDDMGPGTYFLRIILEGGRGDNMRSSDNEKKKKNDGSSSGRNNKSNGEGNVNQEDFAKSDLHWRNNIITDNINSNTTDAHSSNVSTNSSSSSSSSSVASSTQTVKRSALFLQEPALIQRVIFCSGKVQHNPSE